jgi:DNA polymerase-3 subunit beta
MPSIIIGKKTVTEIIKLLADAVEPVVVAISGTRIEVTVTSSNSRAVLGSRLIDGAFPDFEVVLRTQHEKKLVAGTRLFADAIDRVGTVINDKSRLIRVTLTRNLMRCAAIEGTNCTADEDIDVDFDYEEHMEFYFDVRFLLDIAQHITTEELEIALTNPDTAISVRPVGISGVFFALMAASPQTTRSE